MQYIKFSLIALLSTAIVPSLIAQPLMGGGQPPKGNMRVDTSRTIIRDAYGNVIGQSFEVRMEGSFESRREQLKSQKVAFFSSNIDLTSKEAEKFWPVYNEYTDKIENLKMEQRKVLRQLSEFEYMENEKDVKALLDAYLGSFAKENELLQEYYKKFSSILPPKKVARLYQTEEQFKQILLRSIRGR